MQNFKDVVERNLKKIELYSPIVARVHGDAHPEFLELKKVIDVLILKIKNNNLELDEEFDKANKITNGFTLPEGVCETYTEVYFLLKELKDTYKRI